MRPSLLFFALGLFLMAGFVVVNPNESSVLVLFGAYKGTIKKNGFFWVNPFFSRKKISLRARNLDSEPIKVNDQVTVDYTEPDDLNRPERQLSSGTIALQAHDPDSRVEYRNVRIRVLP